MDHVIQQIRELLNRGVVEINLIAQDLAAYGSDQGHADFPLLLRKISELQGEFWVRLLYIHPDNFPIEILSIMRDDPRILPYFDIPFQHASTKVLRKMGRTGTFSQYADMVENIRAELSDSVIRTTLMTGFPGEGNSEYRELLRFQQEVAFDWAGVFTFSREEGTPAYRMRGTLAQRLVEKRAEARKNELEEIQSGISAERMDRFVGRDLRILVEEQVKKEELALGRAYLQAPEVDGASVVLSDRFEAGRWETMRVLRRNNFDLEVAPLDELV
jgi:ribosomal protein S12 methylthiotransferase